MKGDSKLNEMAGTPTASHQWGTAAFEMQAPHLSSWALIPNPAANPNLDLYLRGGKLHSVSLFQPLLP